MAEYAIAGAYRNNCAFHCLAHKIFTQDEATIRKLFERFPIFTEMMMEFYDRYQLGDNYNIDAFLSLMNKFSHPADREILFGEVFRCLLQKMATNNPEFNKYTEELKEGKLVSDDLLAKFANLCGMNLTIHVGENSSPFDLKSEIKNPLLTLDIYHTKRGGGHYNFSYGEPYLNNIHNQQFAAFDEWGQSKPIGHSDLFDKSNMVGVKEQDMAIKEEVQVKYQQVLNSPSSSKSGYKR